MALEGSFRGITAVYHPLPRKNLYGVVTLFLLMLSRRAAREQQRIVLNKSSNET